MALSFFLLLIVSQPIGRSKAGTFTRPGFTDVTRSSTGTGDDGVTAYLIPIEPGDCYYGNGESYNGTYAITIFGRKCVTWPAFIIERHKDWFAQFGEINNYCRNPNGTKTNPWCVDGTRRSVVCSMTWCPVHSSTTEFKTIGTELTTHIEETSTIEQISITEQISTTEKTSTTKPMTNDPITTTELPVVDADNSHAPTSMSKTDAVLVTVYTVTHIVTRLQ